MSAGLSVSRIASVSINLSPVAATARNLSTLLILGSTDVIDTVERFRSYEDIASVADDFSGTDPEYLAAALYFAQNPRPTQLYIGRWAETPTAGALKGGALSGAEQTIATWQAVVAGAFVATVDGVLKSPAGLDFSGAANLNAVAAIIDAAIAGAGVVWDAEHARFVIKSDTTGAASTVTYAGAPGAGTDISAMIKGTAVTAAQIVPGLVAETPLAAVTLMDDLPFDWYAVEFALDSGNGLSPAEAVTVALYIEASDPPHVFANPTSDTAVLDPGSTTDVASLLKAANYSRSFTQYSADPNAVASAMARILTTDFNANNSIITLKFKQEPGVTAEQLTSGQVNALEAKNANVLVQYANNTAILEEGVMANGAYFDEIFGLDWLRDAVQTGVFNLLYTSKTKIPQTDAGNRQIANVIAAALEQGVDNGLIAAGVWTVGGFGQLAQGDYMPTGYYVYTPPIASQSQADREARKSVPFQIAVKLAGAIHSVDVLIDVNR